MNVCYGILRVAAFFAERTPASVCVVRVSGAWRLLVHGARSKIFIRIHLNRLRYRRLKAQTIKSMLSSIFGLVCSVYCVLM